MWDNPIEHRYLLVVNIPHFQLPDGSTAVDDLWKKDLERHLLYIRHLALASPGRKDTPPASARPIGDEPGYGHLEHVSLPPFRSSVRAAIDAPRTLYRLWKAVGRADIVHTGVAGWPYPLGWPAALFAKLRGKYLYINIESAPWRLGLRPGTPFAERMASRLYETMARWSVGRSDMSTFTQAEYRDSFLKPGQSGYVFNASWIDEATILPDAQAQTSWDQKLAQPVRLIFAGRITMSKGVDVLIQALRSLAEAKVPVHVDFMGQGELLPDCEALAAELKGATTAGILAPVPYDASFFETLRRYHAVLVPSVGDEQPRIIYDAFSQAVPVIASDTAGIRDCATDGETSILVPPGDASALASAIREGVEQPERFRQLGLAALPVARRLTLDEVHRQKHQLLLERLAKAVPVRS